MARTYAGGGPGSRIWLVWMGMRACTNRVPVPSRSSRPPLGGHLRNTANLITERLNQIDNYYRAIEPIDRDWRRPFRAVGHSKPSAEVSVVSLLRFLEAVVGVAWRAA
jgi:hypothetical protein